jgi:hypothetical protein
MEEWGGADVMICTDPTERQREWAENQPLVVDATTYVPRRRLVVTRHARALTWLFYQFREIYSDRIDYVNKYPFYGTLAQAALDYVAQHGDAEEVESLLLTVLDAGVDFWRAERASQQ